LDELFVLDPIEAGTASERLVEETVALEEARMPTVGPVPARLLLEAGAGVHGSGPHSMCFLHDVSEALPKFIDMSQSVGCGLKQING
jgi:hypothetical protein